jgi:hypothetical protein
MENLNDPIGNRIGDLPACNLVPQPTAPLRISWKADIATNTKSASWHNIALYESRPRLVCKLMCNKDMYNINK